MTLTQPSALNILQQLQVMSSTKLLHVLLKLRYALYRAYHLSARNEPCALKLPVSVLVPRAPQEVMVVKIKVHIVPARITSLVIDHPVRCIKLGARMRETTDKNDRNSATPRQPGQPTSKPNEEISVLDQVDALLQRKRTCEVFATIRHAVKE